MLDVHQKRKLRSVLYNRITLGVLLVLVLFFIHSTWVVYQKKETTEKLKTLSFQQTQELLARDKELQAQIERINTAAGVEAEIRSKFNVVKPEENMVIIVENSDTGVSSATTSSPSLWKKILNFFFK
jgi:cell division protein FtsB